MFLDEELELIYANEHDRVSRNKTLLKLLLAKVKENNLSLEKLKRINNSYKLFASRHPDINPEGFKLCLIKIAPESKDLIEKLFR